jgi:flagellar biogenesis protein FliO
MSSWGSFLEKGGAALLVLLLLLVVVWLLQRQGLAHFVLAGRLGKKQRLLHLVERLPLTSQHSLYLVQTEDQLLLLGSSPSGIGLIETLGSHGRASESAAGARRRVQD